MKKLATFVLFLSLGAFTIGPVVGCGGKDDKETETDTDNGDDTGDDTGSEDES